MTGKLDQWARWLLHRRHGGNEARLRATLEFLAPIRDRVLDGAKLADGETLLDVGCGDGLIAFGALERTAAGRVIFSDISTALLDHCRSLATRIGVADRSTFVEASADSLVPIADESVEAVTTRSVLIYVKDKRACFDSFYRVLKPGGRVSLFEPINRFGFPGPENYFWGYEVTPVLELAIRVRALFNAIQPPDTDPMIDFDERDLVALAEAAGFPTVRLDLVIEIRTTSPDNDAGTDAGWQRMLDAAPNPRVPTLSEAVEQVLNPDERGRFLDHLRRQYTTQPVTARSASAFLTATKAALN